MHRYQSGPERPRWIRGRRPVVVVAAAAAATAAAAAVESMPGSPVPDWMESARSALDGWGLLDAIRSVSQLGDAGILAALAVAIGLTTRDRRLVLGLVAALLLTLLIAPTLKQLVARERPFESGPHSFPSGHTSAAMTFALALGAHRPRHLPALLAAAVAVATSRVLLGRHWPSDVLGGAAIGALSTAISLRLVRPGPAAPLPLWLLTAAAVVGVLVVLTALLPVRIGPSDAMEGCGIVLMAGITAFLMREARGAASAGEGR